MKLMSILSGQGFVMYNKDLARSVSINGAIIFGQLCSSYESFGNKNMLTIREGREYFFLTSETLEKETSLTYKQQLKAAKELEVAGYIETKVMGVPSKKYFHITDKIVEVLLLEGNPKSDKREDLNIPTDSEENTISSRNEKKEHLGMTKGNGKPLQKGSTIKKKNKKEKDNNNINVNCNYKESLTSEKFREILMEESNEFYTEFSVGRWSKKSWNILINKFVDDTITSGRWTKVPEDKIKGYAYKSLEKMCYNSDYKHDEELNEFRSMKIKVPEESYNWLES
ncbi:hypothetical protein [Peribacillus butanolivorans]|uniref:hypothetical protein n=1 Tax=Peribacillus butanolivorans TaxID=421767 RepID=UPI003648A13E